MLKKAISGLLLVTVFSSQVFAGGPFRRQGAVILGGNHCVTPFQTFSSPVFSYSQPIISQSYAPKTVVSSVDNYSAKDDVSDALRVISEFKLKQQALDQGLQSLGYSSQKSYAQPQEQNYQPPQVNYGLAPYQQGTTQYQVESMQLSSFGSNMEGINEQLNALTRLAENMQKNSATVSASVGGSVQTMTESVADQAAQQVEITRIQAEAAARMAMIAAATEMLKESRLSEKVDVTYKTETQTSQSAQGEVISSSVESSQQTATTAEPEVTALDVESQRQLVLDSCAKCHAGEKPAGGFSLNAGTLNEAEIASAVTQVFIGEMPPKGKLSVVERVRLGEALQSFREE